MSNSNEVYLKNIPLSFLKNKDDSFFKSKDYLNAIKLFDSIKKPYNNVSDAENNELLPLEMVKDLLISKYSDTLTEDLKNIKSKELLQDYIIAILIGKKPVNVKTKLRKNLTKSVSDIPEIEYKAIVSGVTNKLDILKNEVKNITYDKLDKSKLILSPSKTEDVLFDITSKVKWYENLYDDSLYDDYKYKSNMIKNLVRNTKNSTSGYLHTLAVDDINPVYKFKDKNRLSVLDKMKKLLLDKYITPTGTIGAKATLEIDINTNLKSFVDKALFNNRNKDRLSIYYYDNINLSKDVLINHNLNINNFFKIMAFDSEGNIRLDYTYTCDINNVTILFDKVFIGSIILLYDTYNNSNISMNLLSYLKINKGIDKLVRHSGSIESNQIFILDSINNMNGYFECYNGENIVNIESAYIDYSNNTLNIKSEFDIHYVLFICTYKYYSGTNVLKIDQSNIDAFISKYSIFSDKVVIWG